MRFKLKYDRDVTMADCVAHLTKSEQDSFKIALAVMNQRFTWPKVGDPIKEPVAIVE
jgi:hypothetical protein